MLMSVVLYLYALNFYLFERKKMRTGRDYSYLDGNETTTLSQVCVFKTLLSFGLGFSFATMLYTASFWRLEIDMKYSIMNVNLSTTRVK